jgi:hypothetical protein
MALFSPGFTPCPLCGEIIAEGDDDLVSTSHFIGDHEHPLYPYSDAVMHRACFLKWEQRAAYVAAYNADARDDYMRADGTIGERFLFWFPRAVIDKIFAVESWFRRRPD